MKPEYKYYKRKNIITKDGHTMFLTDVVHDIKYLQQRNKELEGNEKAVADDNHRIDQERIKYRNALKNIKKAYQEVTEYESKLKVRYTEEYNQIWILDGCQMEDDEVKYVIKLRDILEEKLEVLKDKK